MTQVLVCVVTLLLWIPAILCGVTTEDELEVLEGESLTVPCFYEPQYASYVKYWCRGRTREFCTSLIRTDTPRSGEAKLNITDDKVQQLFTVNMKELKEEDSAWYMCGVEIGGAWNPDAAAFTYIKVIHGMKVRDGRLSGGEGSSVTVECLYSERYRGSEKKWCRIGDWNSCLLVDSEGSYDDTSVAMSDNRNGTFTVTVKKLQMRHAGWYWCMAGELKKSVQVIVTPRTTAKAVSETSRSPPRPSVSHVPPPKAISRDSCQNLNFPLMFSASVMIFVALAIFLWTMFKLYKPTAELKSSKGVKTRLSEYSGDAGDLQDSTVLFLNSSSQKIHMY